MLDFNNIGNPGESVAEGHDNSGGAFVLPYQAPDNNALNAVQHSLDYVQAEKQKNELGRQAALQDAAKMALTYKDVWDQDKPDIQKKGMEYFDALKNAEIQFKKSGYNPKYNPDLLYTDVGGKLAGMKQDVISRADMSKQQRAHYDKATELYLKDPTKYYHNGDEYKKLPIDERSKYPLQNLLQERFNLLNHIGAFRKVTTPENITQELVGQRIGDNQQVRDVNTLSDPQIQQLVMSMMQHPGYDRYAKDEIAKRDPTGQLGLTPQQIALQDAQANKTFKGDLRTMNVETDAAKEARRDYYAEKRDDNKAKLKGDGASPISLPIPGEMQEYTAGAGEGSIPEGHKFKVTKGKYDFQYKNYNIPDASESSGAKKAPNTFNSYRQLDDGTWEINDTHSNSATVAAPQVDANGKPIMEKNKEGVLVQKQWGKVSPTGWRKVHTWDDLVLPSIENVTPKNREATLQKAKQVLYDIGLDENSITPADLGKFQALMNGTAVPAQATTKGAYIPGKSK